MSGDQPERGSERSAETDGLIRELKVRRLVENQVRLGFGLLPGLLAAIVLEEGARILAGGKILGFMVWMAAILVAANVVHFRFARDWVDHSIQRQLGRSSKRLTKSLDHPGSIAVHFAMTMGGIMACSLFLSVLIDFPGSTTVWMSLPFAFALVWGGLRFRIGDDLVCARCEYPKTPESGDICPECGSAWIIADTLALGRPAVVPWMIVAGVAGIGVDVAMVAMSV